MTNDDGNGFKEFVRGEIKNTKDAAERNYIEHKEMFREIGDLKVGMVTIETKLDAAIDNQKSRRALKGKLWLALISSITALILGALSFFTGCSAI